MGPGNEVCESLRSTGLEGSPFIHSQLECAQTDLPGKEGRSRDSAIEGTQHLPPCLVSAVSFSTDSFLQGIQKPIAFSLRKPSRASKIPEAHVDQAQRSWRKKRCMGGLRSLNPSSGCFLFPCHVTPCKSLLPLTFTRKQGAIITLHCGRDKMRCSCTLCSPT